ncbi:hypothetical protein EWB00_010407 [Schistosoma japonicum]|uniref:Uncharacterized protein n=2 Tax=Schistosoma japonicum TaxID=6182 RepID=A0A4Z2DXQ4_SCHJA|nr:hypothetical protein KSF78_0005344 [Schistosoma japonicum]KAH8877865.1 hypothetical protein KSF78_0005344 [Schistosoma japonicum]TNN21229.1 hypothetical protein EWB00_010407 [Schistosoma japonicum]TNN21231.1 hypothetical protein EWB00_010407 [Schistosoma japonicum]
MVEDKNRFTSSVRRKYPGNSVIDSSFYTDNLKSSVFNFMAEPKPNIQGVNYVANNLAKIPHISEKRKGLSPVPDSAIPHKYYLCETAMANHFAQMNLALPIDASKVRNDCSTPPVSVSPCFPFDACQIASANHMYQNLSLCSDNKGDITISNEDEDSDEEAQDDRSPLLFSDDLKDHLRFKRMNPTDTFLRGLLVSEPSLAIVPFDPDRFNGLFSRNSSNQASCEEDSDATVLSDCRAPDSPVISPTLNPTFDNFLCMDVDSDITE